jgi:hypothetical protein
MKKDTIKALITTVIADSVGTDVEHVNLDAKDVLNVLDREGRNVVGSYVAVAGERPWTPGNPVKFETRFHTTVWCAPEEVRIEFCIRDHEEGRYDDRLCDWEDVTLSRDEFISHVREAAKRMGVDVSAYIA